MSWNHHKKAHNLDLFAPEHRQTLAAAVQRVLDDVMRVTFLVADRMKLEVTVKEVEALFMFKGRREFIEQLADGGFHPGQYSQLREKCVSSWDSHWEPRFRTAIAERGS